MTPSIIKTEELRNPRFNKMSPDTFLMLYPFSIESGETHLGSYSNEHEAKAQLDVFEEMRV